MNRRRLDVPWAIVALALTVLASACAERSTTEQSRHVCRSPSSSSGGVPSLPPESLPPGLADDLATFLVTPGSEVVIERFEVSQLTAFVLFSFKEGSGENHGFGSFVDRDGRWTPDQVATDLWHVLPAACSGKPAVLSLQTSGVSYTGGYTDPTIDRLDVLVGTQVVGSDRPLAGRVLVKAPVGAHLLAYRGLQLVWNAEVKNNQRSP